MQTKDLTTRAAREILDECLREEGVIDHGSIRRDKAAAHFARDLEAFDEREARDDDNTSNPFPALALVICVIAAMGLVGAVCAVAWMNA